LINLIHMENISPFQSLPENTNKHNPSAMYEMFSSSSQCEIKKKKNTYKYFPEKYLGAKHLFRTFLPEWTNENHFCR
jgi:hypothetical protein